MFSCLLLLLLLYNNIVVRKAIAISSLGMIVMIMHVLFFSGEGLILQSGLQNTDLIG